MLSRLRSLAYDVLRWSEKWIKTDMVYLTKGGFWLTLGQGISISSSLILSIIFANILPKEVYGTYRYILSICGILTITTLSGMNTSVIRSIARSQEHVFFKALKAKIYWGLWGALGSLLISGYYLFQHNLGLAAGFLIVAAFLPVMDSFALYDSILQGKKNFRLSTRYSVITQCLATLTIIITAVLTKDVYLILLSYFVSWTVLRFFFLKRSLETYRLNNQDDPEAVPYGKHLSFMLIPITVANYFDRLLIFHFLGAAEVAIYSIAIAPPEQIKGLLKNLNTLALPKFSKKSLAEINETIWGKMLKLSLIIGLVVILYIIAAPLLFHIFFPAYSEAIPLSQLFTLSLLATVMYIPLSIMQSQKLSGQLYRFNLLTSIFQIAALLAIIPCFNLYTVVAARIASRLFGLLVAGIQLKRAAAKLPK